MYSINEQINKNTEYIYSYCSLGTTNEHLIYQYSVNKLGILVTAYTAIVYFV